MKSIWLIMYLFSSLGTMNLLGQEGLVGYWSFDILESGLEIEGYVIIGPVGKIISSVHTKDKTGTIPLEGLIPGMYNLEFRTADQTIHHKLIIQGIKF